MKKRVTFLAALLVAACFGATVAMAEGSAKVTAQSGLNMRQGPGINYNVVTVLNNGATVNVVTPDDGNGWAYVTSGKNAGWVATKYLSGSAATTQAPSWRGSAVNCTVKSDANIRRGPGTDFGVLGVVPAGVGRACGFVRKRMAGAEHRVQLPDNGHPRPRAAPKPAFHACARGPRNVRQTQRGKGLQHLSGRARFLIAQLRMGKDIPPESGEALCLCVDGGARRALERVCHCVHSPLTLSMFQDSAQRTRRR